MLSLVKSAEIDAEAMSESAGSPTLDVHRAGNVLCLELAQIQLDQIEWRVHDRALRL